MENIFTDGEWIYVIGMWLIAIAGGLTAISCYPAKEEDDE